YKPAQVRDPRLPVQPVLMKTMNWIWVRVSRHFLFFLQASRRGPWPGQTQKFFANGAGIFPGKLWYDTVNRQNSLIIKLLILKTQPSRCDRGSQGQDCSAYALHPAVLP